MVFMVCSPPRTDFELSAHVITGACATVDKSSACNATQFGYPFQPLGQVMADTSTDRGRRDAIPNLVGSDVGLFDANYNQIISRVANILIFVSRYF